MRNCSSVEQPACNAQHMLLGRIWPALRVLNLLAVQVAHIKGGNKGAVRAKERNKFQNFFWYFEFISLVAFHIAFGLGDQLTYAYKNDCGLR